MRSVRWLGTIGAGVFVAILYVAGTPWWLAPLALASLYAIILDMLVIYDDPVHGVDRPTRRGID